MNSLISLYLVSFLFPLLIVLGAIPFLKRIAIKVGFVDIPSARKVHFSPVPLGGGIGIYLAFISTMVFISVFFDQDISGTVVGIIAGGTLLVIIGVMDDFLDLDYLTKLLGQGISAFIFLVFLNITSPYLATHVQLAVMILWIMSLENALNFLDNMDGLCSGISMIAAVGFGILFLFKEMPLYAAVSFATAGATLGFLRYNLARASIFLGDAGSLFLGFLLASLGLVHLNSSKDMISALIPMLVVSYPFFDLLFVTISRLKEGRKLYIGGTDHSSHKMNVMGFTKRKTVFVIHFINIILVCLAVILFLRQDSPFYSLIIIFFAFTMAFIGAHLYRNFLFLAKRIVAGIIDLIAINISLMMFYIFKYEIGILGKSDHIPFAFLLAPMVWISLFWIFLFAVFGLYEIHFEMPLRSRLFILVKSILTGTTIFLILNFKPGEGFQISLTSISIFITLLFLILSILKAVIYQISSRYLHSEAGALNTVLLRPSISKKTNLTISLSGSFYNVLGYTGIRTEENLEWLGDISELNVILKNTKTARIILDIDDSDYSDLREIFKYPYFMETIFLITSDLKKNLTGLKRYSTVNKDLDIISIRHRKLFLMIFNRLVNALLSSILIILFSPYWIIKLFSLKMKNEAISDDIHIMNQHEKEMKIKRFKGNDKPLGIANPWVLLAILKGKLNIYGVTINSSEEYKRLKYSIPGYWRKFLMKPGIFGPGYTVNDDNDRFTLDLMYLEKTSLFGDLRMMIKQIFGKIQTGE
ncbi:MAG: MraY family glycosyltransferase [candidate division Zixibacteria bacterium]